MANLPNNTFVFNYNAKDYNSTTRTIPNHSAATLAMNMEFKHTTNTSYANESSAITVSTDHISFTGGTYAQFAFSNSGGSPFNITNANPNLTLVIKMWRDPNAASITPGTTSVQSDVLANRGTSSKTFNWLARCDDTKAYFHTATSNDSATESVTWTANPVTLLYRVTNQSVEVKNITEGISNTPFTPSYNLGTNRVTFFGQGYQTVATDVRNCIGGDFYWAYLSRESLTDAQVQEVIAFNDSIDSISINTNTLTFSSNGGSNTVNVTAPGNWTAVVSDSWITASTLTGTSGLTTVTISTPDYSMGAAKRTGTITFTCNGDSVVLTVVQNILSYIVNVALGDKVPSAIYLGDDHLEACYLGDTLIFPITGTGTTVVSDVITDPSEIQAGDVCLFYCPGHERYVSNFRTSLSTPYCYSYRTFYPASYTHQGAGYVRFDDWDQAGVLKGYVTGVTESGGETYVHFSTPGHFVEQNIERFGPAPLDTTFSGSFRLMSDGSLRITPGILVGKLKDTQTIQFGTETDNMSDPDANFKKIVLRKIIMTT